MSKRSCFCGCDHFRFKMNEVKEGNDNQELYYNICINCNHTLAEHINIIRSKQSD